MNVFHYLMLILISFALIVRSQFYVTSLYYTEDAIKNPKAVNFVWTYPLINMVIVAYTVSSHWVYDMMTIITGN